jgi:hypothetical protein
MAKWNKDKKVLDHEHTQFWKFDLKDVKEPNLQKDVFPYDEVCRIDFDHKIISINPADEIFITDTTFRDGQQARPPYTVQQIVDLYTMMSRLGGPNGVIRQSEFFLYSAKDREAWRSAKALVYAIRRSPAGSGPVLMTSLWSNRRA